jgi:hypothetical protein
VLNLSPDKIGGAFEAKLEELRKKKEKKNPFKFQK